MQRRARSGTLLLLGRRAFALAINVLAVVTIARLVPPRAYGLATMSALIFSFADMLKDFGLTSALLRKGTISSDEVNFLFWFNAGTTTSLTLVLAASAPLVASFFHEAVVAPIMLTALVGFFAGGLSLQHRALLNRALRFKALAVIDSSSLALQYVITLALAVLRHDVWAIVIGNACASSVSAVLITVASGWRPTSPRRISDLKSILAFGANASIFSLSGFISNSAPPALIGRFLGPVSLGHYNRAAALVTLPLYNVIEPVAQATLPVLARLRPNPGAYRQVYLGLIRQMNMICIPVAVVLTFIAKPLVLVVLGPRWFPAGEILAALAPSFAAVGSAYAISDLFITQDRSTELRWLGLFELTIRAAAVGGFVVFGVFWTAVAYSISTLISVVVRVVVAGRSGPVGVKDHIQACAGALPVSVGSALGCLASYSLLKHAHWSAVLTVVGVSTGGAVIGGVSGLFFRESRTTLADLLRILVPVK